MVTEKRCVRVLFDLNKQHSLRLDWLIIKSSSKQELGCKHNRISHMDSVSMGKDDNKRLCREGITTI